MAPPREKRLIDKTRTLTLELARQMGLDEKQCEQLELSVLEELQKRRKHVFRVDERKQAEQEAKESKKKNPQKGHGTAASAAAVAGRTSGKRAPGGEPVLQGLRQNRR